MKGLDTNVLVRYLVKDDKKQSETASGYIQKAANNGESCFISLIVLCELVWVLESAYGFAKHQVIDVLEKLFLTKQIEIEMKDIARQALQDYKNGKGDIADYLVGRINRAHGCDTTATFDKALKKSGMFHLLG
ncbi:MAG: type II toxin-antitoxin system VapC family toxin [Pseudomonadota bacterium]